MKIRIIAVVFVLKASRTKKSFDSSVGIYFIVSASEDGLLFEPHALFVAGYDLMIIF